MLLLLLLGLHFHLQQSLLSLLSLSLLSLQLLHLVLSFALDLFNLCQSLLLFDISLLLIGQAIWLFLLLWRLLSFIVCLPEKREFCIDQERLHLGELESRSSDEVFNHFKMVHLVGILVQLVCVGKQKIIIKEVSLLLLRL